ncbi:MAG: DUF167 domain-containing protein [Acidimicrobiales bacterium]
MRLFPRARATSVGGRYGDSEPPVLVVRIAAPAVDGAANAAMIAALVAALGVPRRGVHIASGHRGHTKIVEVEGADGSALANLLLE